MSDDDDQTGCCVAVAAAAAAVLYNSRSAAMDVKNSVNSVMNIDTVYVKQ